MSIVRESGRYSGDVTSDGRATWSGEGEAGVQGGVAVTPSGLGSEPHIVWAAGETPVRGVDSPVTVSPRPEAADASDEGGAAEAGDEGGAAEAGDEGGTAETGDEGGAADGRATMRCSACVSVSALPKTKPTGGPLWSW